MRLPFYVVFCSNQLRYLLITGELGLQTRANIFSIFLAGVDDFFTCFLIDNIKGRPNKFYRQKTSVRKLFTSAPQI